MKKKCVGSPKNALFVQPSLVSFCVAKMFAVGAGKPMFSSGLWFGTHVQMVVLRRRQNAKDVSRIDVPNGAWWQALVPIRIVGIVDVLVHIQHPANTGVIQGINQGRVSLKCHALFQAIEVKSSHHRGF